MNVSKRDNSVDLRRKEGKQCVKCLRLLRPRVTLTCDVTACGLSVRNTAERHATVGGKAVGLVAQVPSLALTRCETSPISARP